MTKPLTGLLVVSLEQAVAAPLASCRLADAGARVIKIERPEGDFARGYDRAANGGSSYFAWLNRGKESLVLDIKEEGGSVLLHRMLARADVFIQNLAAGAAARAGLGWRELQDKYPRLITCNITGYGEEGPYADMKAYDLLVQAESGLVSVTGVPGQAGRVGVSICDFATGMNAALAIHEALARRRKTGRGEAIHVSLFDTMAEWMVVALLHYDYLGKPPQRLGVAHPSIAPYGDYQTSGGEALVISIQSDREWRIFADKILGDAALGTDPRFATNNSRVENRAAMDAIIRARFAKSSRAGMEDTLRRGRIAYGAINDVAGLSRHPQLKRVTVETEYGPVALPAHPARLDAPGYGPVPSIGQHSEAIRAEFGGPAIE